MTLQAIDAVANVETQIDENFEALDWGGVYAKNPNTTTGLTWGYYGGRWGGTAISNGTLSLTGSGSPDAYNYIVVNRATGAASVSTATTNWNNVADYARAYRVITNASGIDQIEDWRAGPYGVFATGMRPLSWNTQSGTTYTLALTDAENAVAMSNAAANTITVPLNATVAFPVGTRVTIYQEGLGSTNLAGAGGVTIRNREPSSPTEYRLKGQFAVATLLKRGADEWILYGDIY